MTKKVLEIGGEVIVTITRCDGRLRLQGGSSGLLTCDSKGEFHIEQGKGEVFVSAESDCTISVPQTVPVVVKTVSGSCSARELRSLSIESAGDDVKVDGIWGSLSLGSVQGDLEVKKSKNISADVVFGDVEIKDNQGDVRIVNVRNDFSLRNWTTSDGVGKTEINQIGGSVFLSKLGGELKLDSVNGDVVLQGPLKAGKHHIIAAGDVIVYWGLKDKVQLLITHAGKLFNSLNLQYDVSKKGEFTATIGDDSCKLIIDSKEDVFLWPLKGKKSKSAKKSKPKKEDDFDFDFELEDLFDPEELLEKIGEGIKSLVMLQRRNKGKGLLGRIFGQALREVDEWAGVPQERGAREEEIRPEAENSEEERRIILKMLENGTITVDEAAERLKRL